MQVYQGAIASAAEEEVDESPEDIVFDDHVMRLAFHPSASVIAASSVTGEVRLFEYALAGNTQRASLTHHTLSTRALQFSQDGGTLFTGSLDASIGAYDLNAGKLSGVLSNAHESAINSMLVLDPTTLVSGDENGIIKIWDLRQQRCCQELKEHEDYIADLALGPDGKTLLAAGGDGYLSVWNRKSGKLTAMSDQIDDEFLSLAILKNGKKVLCGSQSGVLSIFSWGDWGDVSDRFPGHPQSVESMAKIDEDTVCTCSEDGIIRIVSVPPPPHCPTAPPVVASCSLGA
jgi:WD40 repeat protein